jgi:hypothetical protein
MKPRVSPMVRARRTAVMGSLATTGAQAPGRDQALPALPALPSEARSFCG